MIKTISTKRVHEADDSSQVWVVITKLAEFQALWGRQKRFEMQNPDIHKEILPEALLFRSKF